MKFIFPSQILYGTIVKYSFIFLIFLFLYACSEEAGTSYKTGIYEVKDIQVYAQTQPIIGNLEKLQQIRDGFNIETVKVSEKEIVVNESNFKFTFVVTPELWAINKKYTFKIDPKKSNEITLKSINYPDCMTLNCVVEITISRKN